MIYLIGGSPRSGKTILSKKLSKKLGVPCLSTDILRLFMVASLKEDDRYDYFPFEKMFDSAGAVDTFYKETSGEDMLSADLEEAKNLMPGLIAFIEHFKNSGSDYILEGVHFLPSLVAKLKNNKQVKIIILTKTDHNEIHQGLKENKGKDDWIADNIDSDEVLSKAAKSLSQYGEYFESESEKYGIKYLNTENSFSDKIAEALSYLE